LRYIYESSAMSDDVLWEKSAFRPSYSATWLYCAGSLLPSLAAEDTAGREAAVGTIFHELMVYWAEKGRPDDWLGEHRDIEGFDVEVDEDMFSFGEECFRRYEDIPGDRFYETKVDISSITPIPNQSGTADKAICSAGQLDIIDYKYGTGVQVFAYKNTQLLLYALGFFNEFDYIYGFNTIRLHIAQPRLYHWDVWEITRDELLEFADWAKKRAAAAWVPNADRSPSPRSCQWCRVRLTCPAFEAARSDLCDLTFTAMDEPVTHERQLAIIDSQPSLPALMPPVELSTAQLERILTFRKTVESWFKDAHETLVERGIRDSSELTLFKVVNGRSKRAYFDEDEAAERYRRLGLLEDDIYVRKLKSPNQMEPELRKIGIRGKLTKEWLKLIAPPQPGRPTLTISDDARAEIPNIVDQTFEDEEGQIPEDPEAV
jgi:hypothetical protein